MAADAVNWTGECQAGRLFILVAVAVASPVYNTDLIIAAVFVLGGQPIRVCGGGAVY